VSLHGSEPGTKDNFGQKIMSHYMISQGIAILTYDKRGVGESGGVYIEAPTEKNLNNHSADVTAGAEYLITRPEIDASRIGLIGGSQAGWVIPLAASQSDLFSFFVIISGPVVSFGQEDMYSNVTNDGDTDATFDAEALNQRVRDLKPRGFDPLPILQTLNQKGIWLWGGVDKSVPTVVSAENLQALINSGKTNFSYVMFPNGDHNLNISRKGLFDEIPFSPGVVYFQSLTDWLQTYILEVK
jgi:predicted peptidase